MSRRRTASGEAADAYRVVTTESAIPTTVATVMIVNPAIAVGP